MNATAIDLAIALLDNLPRLIQASAEVLALINSTAVSLAAMRRENRDPTDAEWNALNSVITTLTARIDKDPT